MIMAIASKAEISKYPTQNPLTLALGEVISEMLGPQGGPNGHLASEKMDFKNKNYFH